jgi:glycosyltransferase involved in cell wall biosynthesis
MPADSSERPLVSIVMCVFNPRPDWFRAAVASVLEQRDCRVELIVVDDGSTTSAADALHGMLDERVRIIRVEHAGIANARNAGIDAAEGTYFRFVDGDDVLEPWSTSRLVALSAPDGAIAYGATVVCDEDLRPLSVKSSRLEGHIAEECVCYRFDVKHMSMLFPRQAVADAGPWDTSLRQCQDWDFVLRALEHAPARGEQEAATFYRRHTSSMSANLEQALRHESMVVDRYFERHPEQAGTSLERDARAKLLLVRADACRRLGAGRVEQLRLIARAAQLHPGRTGEELTAKSIHFARRATRRLARAVT